MSTYLQICKDVRAQAGIAGDGPSDVTGQTGIEADVVRWVTEAYNDIQTLHENWNFLWTEESFLLPVGNSSYPVLSTFGLRQVSADSWRAADATTVKYRLYPLSWVAWKNSYMSMKDKDERPTTVIEQPNGTFKFYPTPLVDTTITFEGFKVPDVMTTSTDVPIFPAQYHELIQLKALMKYTEYYSAPELLNTVVPAYDELLSKMQFSELPKNNIYLPPFV